MYLFSQGLGATAVPDVTAEPHEQEQITSQRWMIPSTIATQIIGNAPGVVGAVVGFILAQKLAASRNVSATEVLIATGVVVIAAAAGVFIIRTVEE